MPESRAATAVSRASSAPCTSTRRSTAVAPSSTTPTGNPIPDPFQQPGFPGFDGMPANVTLGYIAQMQEAGVPVTFGYISDAHDNHTNAFPAPSDPNGVFPRASGPGESDYVSALHESYDDAFGAFFHRLKKDGINKSNTLFVVTADENDHFAGGDSNNGIWSHSTATSTRRPVCPANQIGEVNANLVSLLPSGEPTSRSTATRLRPST